MARLNEPAPPIESIESLKRRFIRQNRDIARANSTQSLRIRNLENETSRLLAENLVLREQILRLQSELEADRAQQIVENTRAAKSQLEEKLLELGALISGLGLEPARKKSPPVTKAVGESPSQSPAQRKWKNMYTMGEFVRGPEGSLPPIMENKTYPRKTLELRELEDLISDEVADTTNSPEIGPPPISQFVDEDPVKVDLAIRPRKVEHEEILGLDPTFSVNLEHRKKRKDSIGSQESRRGSKDEPIPRERDSTNPLKTGAKRKLSVRDDDEHEVPVKSLDVSPDDFQFTRVTSEEKSRNKVVAQSEKSSSKAARDFAAAKGVSREKQPSSTVPANRKALAPKSVNDSPRKGSTRAVVSGGIKEAKIDSDKPHHPKERSQERTRDSVSIKRPESVIRTSEIHIEPQAPAEPDIFSPPSSQPATKIESRDTPPPADIVPRGEDPRPSRRSRGSISYAEPNLRAKMRRPTNEFVPAVAVATQQNSEVKVEDQSASDTVKVKTEPASDTKWKNQRIILLEEDSPLKGKAVVADLLPSSITTHRKRRESMLNESEPEIRAPGSAIAALLAEKRRAKAEAREKELQSKEPASNLDIYEFRSSSPDTAKQAPKTREAKPTPRPRRHTAIVRDIAYVDEGDASDIEALKGRRQSTLSLRSSTASADSEKEDGEKTLRKASSSATMADPAVGTRGERIAARRRSMML